VNSDGIKRLETRICMSDVSRHKTTIYDPTEL